MPHNRCPASRQRQLIMLSPALSWLEVFAHPSPPDFITVAVPRPDAWGNNGYEASSFRLAVFYKKWVGATVPAGYWVQ